MKKLSALLVLFAFLFSQAADAVIINSLPYNLTNGSLADATQVMANYNQIVNNANTNAAHNGANSDITSLTGLTTPLAPAYGGTNIYVGGTLGGTANVATLSVVTPTNFANTTGNIVIGTALATNTSAVTLAVNGQTAANVDVQTQAGLAALSGGEQVIGRSYTWLFDGTEFILLNPSIIQGSTVLASASVSNSRLSGMNTATVKGNIAATGSSPADLTGAQVAQLVSAFVKLNRQTFTAGGTYTPCTGLVYADMEVWGGGGGGGGISTGSRTAAGGGAGGYAKGRVSAATVGASQTVTIGTSGGAGNTSGSTGGTGGTTSIGSIVSATGGIGGTGNTSDTTSVNGGVGGAGSAGDIQATGAPGLGSSTNNTANSEMSGAGGNTSLGGAGQGFSNAATHTGASAAANSGSGGGGAAANTAVGTAGGAGGTGYAVVTEYCDQ